MDAKTQYAILKVQESELWQICHELDWPEGLKAQYNDHSEKIEKFGNENFEKLYTITGSSLIHDDGTYKGHYEIEDEIKDDGWKEKGVMLDSESSCFFAYAPESVKDEFFKYLKENFEWEGIGMDWNNFNGYCAPFGRAESAKKFLEENGVEVPTLVSADVLIALERMKYLKKRKEESEKEFEQAIEDLKKSL